MGGYPSEDQNCYCIPPNESRKKGKEDSRIGLCAIDGCMIGEKQLNNSFTLIWTWVLDTHQLRKGGKKVSTIHGSVILQRLI